MSFQQYFVTVGQHDNIQKENSHAGLLRKTGSNHNRRQINEQQANGASDFETALDRIGTGTTLMPASNSIDTK